MNPFFPRTQHAKGSNKEEESPVKQLVIEAFKKKETKWTEEAAPVPEHIVIIHVHDHDAVTDCETFQKGAQVIEVAFPADNSYNLVLHTPNLQFLVPVAREEATVGLEKNVNSETRCLD